MHLTNRRLSLRCVGSLTTVLFFPSRYLLPCGYPRARPSSWLINPPLPHWRYSLTGKSSHMLKALYSFAGFIIYSLPRRIIVIQYQSHSLKKKLSSHEISPLEGQS